MRNTRLWMNQLIRYFIMSHDYAQISFVNPTTSQPLESIWLVNPAKEYMAIHISTDTQASTIARTTQMKNEAYSIFNAFGKQGRILDISFDEAARNFIDEETTFIAIYPQCEVTDAVKRQFPEIGTVIYDVDDPEAEIKKNNDEIKTFLINKMKKSRSPSFHTPAEFLESMSKTYIVAGIICVIVWAALYILSVITKINTTYLGLTFGAYFKPYITALNQWYRLITCGFMHVSLFHLLANMIALRPLSKAVENQFGFAKTIATLLISIVIGSLFVYFSNSNEISVGLSGGIYGLIGALMVILFQEGLFKVPAVRQRLMSTLYLNIILNFLPNVSFMAHLGGFISGVFLGFIFSQKSDKALRTNFTIAGLIIVGFMIGYCIMNHSVSTVYPDLDARMIQVLRRLNLNSYADRLLAMLKKYY
ncbi:MAG: rhomboid family intramembrane serine protease [Erysipelotrichaceae bacterium]|nr:rhomboid family intramembrane serine protease [Erysipelotrichaceae bacterium]